jgi:predicted dienelactone hydrolase
MGPRCMPALRLAQSGFCALVVSAVVGCAPLLARVPPGGSESAMRLATAPYSVASAHVRFHDRARGRTLASTIWWPIDTAWPAPLVVQAHGFLANRTGGTYIATDLASRGYVVVAATHPSTTLFARGGAKVDDVLHQPGDVTFLIDRMLAGDGPRMLAGDGWHRRRPPVDPTRIAVMGHSLGGLTATMTAFHPRLRDPRIAAAISIAGPMAMLEPSFFATAPVPFLMIAGTGDVIVDYRRNALVTLDHVRGGTLVSIAGASHSGFDDAMTGLPRLLDNPDRIACWVLARVLRLNDAMAHLRRATSADDAIDLARAAPPCREDPPRVAMAAADQQRITTLAVTAFLESHFAKDPASRAHAWRYLTETLPRDFETVSVAAAATAPQPSAGGNGRFNAGRGGSRWSGSRPAACTQSAKKGRAPAAASAVSRSGERSAT